MPSPPPSSGQQAEEEGRRQDTNTPMGQPGQAGPAPSAARPIYSFWAGSAGPSSNTPSSSIPSLASTAQPVAQGGAAKKKRKSASAQDGRAQGRLVLSGQGGAWGIKRVEEPAQNANGAGKGKGRARAIDGEAGEIKDMAKRARAEEGDTTKAAKQAAPSVVIQSHVDLGARDSSDIGPGSPSLDGMSAKAPSPLLKSRVPLSDRKRGRPRTSKNLTPTSSRASPEVVDLVSSDPAYPSSPIYHDLTGPGPSFLGGRPLSRTASVSSKGAIDDPIDVETVEPLPKVGPKKLVFAADNKPTHSFFAKKPPVEQKIAPVEIPSAPPTSATGESSTQASLDPATTAESHVPPKPVVVPPKPAKTHSFFNLNTGVGMPGKIKNGWGGGVKEGEEWQAPLPGKDMYRMESAPWPLASTFRFPKRDSKVDISQVDPASISGLIDSSPIPEVSSAPQPTSEVSATRPDHPALQSVKHKSKSTADRETWADKYRPTSAAQVIGNEIEATYLRDWLRTLSLSTVRDGSTQPRKIFRKVKRVRPQLFDGWIVDDAGIFGDPPAETEEEEYVEFYEPEYGLGERPRSHPPLETAQLTNTILLTGDHGCGKTAAVYAAASELGWEVFEVYPGMGKRTGGNLMGWVGDVGKNHLVVKGGSSAKPPESKAKVKSKGLGAFFGSPASKDDDDPIALTGSQGSVGDPIHIDDDGHTPPTAGNGIEGTNGHQADVRQSLILIDEADIQFTEEQTFWPAVVSLIAESRRPVILTCNDLRRIPTDTLPLQTILHFHPPPKPLATAYLEAIASQQSLTDPSNIARHVYEDATRRAPETLSQPLPPNGDEPLPHFDLRHALMQMQLDRKPSPRRQPTTVGEEMDDLASLTRLVEAVSWADAHVEPRYWAVMDSFEVDRNAPTVDDELGVKLLLKPDIHDLHPVLPAFDSSKAMAEQLVALAQPGADFAFLGDLQTARTQYVRGLLPLLDPLIVLSAPLLPSPSLFLLYMPTLQRMVEADDVLEAEEEEAVARGEGRWNRMTGRPKRVTRGGGEGYGRYINLDDVALRAARSSTLVYE